MPAIAHITVYRPTLPPRMRSDEPVIHMLRCIPSEKKLSNSANNRTNNLPSDARFYGTLKSTVVHKPHLTAITGILAYFAQEN